jgi:hypothetical protein
MTENRIYVVPEWFTSLTLQQQCVLLLAGRGPDGVAKNHPCKEIQRNYRGTIFVAGRYGRMLNWGEHADSFMSLAAIGKDELWGQASDDFFDSIDSLPHHFTAHIMHGAEILGYKHPERRFRDRWGIFYLKCVEDLHLAVETEKDMDIRLNDWNRRDW